MAASVWRELSSLPAGEKLLDRYGLVASRWVGAARAERALPPTWLLDKKGFRRALDRELPPGHGIGDIAGDPKHERRASRAARAYDRTFRAARDLELPELPAPPARVLIWTSPVVRPRGIELPFLARSLEVEASAELVRSAIAELWASVYFAECVRAFRAAQLRRVELATGLSLLPPHESAERAGLLDLLAQEEAPRAVVPVPGRVGSRRAESPLQLSLGRVELAALGGALAVRFGRVPEDLWREGPGRFELGVAALAALAEGRPSQERLALVELTGFESRGVALRGEKPSRLSLGRTVGEEILRQSALSTRVKQHEGAVAAAVTALSELDLAVLPDDGLKRTLEDAERLLRENAQVRSEALVSSELLLASAEALEPESALSIDAGLEGLGWLRLLVTWEERLSILRNDSACEKALLARADLPEGPGRRALRDAERVLAHLEPDALGPQEGSEACPAPSTWLLDMARVALLRPSDVGRACREARFAADRRLAAAEARRGHWFGLSLSAVRSLARDAVLLRETTRFLELSVHQLVGRIARDVDRRLGRIEPGLPRGAAFDCTLEELVEAVDLRGSSLSARVAWRRAERRAQRERKLGFWEPVPRARAERVGPVAGEPLSLGEGRGALVHLGGVAGEAEQAPVLVSEAFSPELLLALPYVSGLLVERGRPADSIATVARALGVPVLAAPGLPLATTAQRVILRASLQGGTFDVAEATDGT